MICDNQRYYGVCSAHFGPRLPLFDKLVMMSLCRANIHGNLRYPFISCPIRSYSNLYGEVLCHKNSNL